MGNNNTSYKSKSIRSVSSQTIVTIVLGVIEIVIFSIMSHLLTKEDFGYYSSILAITVVFSSFSETGIGAAIIQKQNADSEFVKNAFTMCFLIGFFLTLLLFCLSTPLSHAVADESLDIPLKLMSITLLCHSLTSINYSLLYKKLKFLKVGMIKIVALVCSGIVSVLLAIMEYGFYAILAQAILTSLLSFVLSYFASGIKYRFSISKKIFSEIWNFSGWLMASVLFRNLAMQIDKLMMPRLLSVQVLGAYNRPRSFIENISTKFNAIVDVSLFPVLSEIQDNQEKMRRAFDKLFFVMSILGTSLGVMLFFNAELLIRIFLGEKWLDLIPLFQILSIAVVFKAYGRLADCLLRSFAMTKQQFYFRIIEFGFKIPAVVLGAKWGIYGVAISVLITDILLRLAKVCYVALRFDYSVMIILSKIIVSYKSLIIILPCIIISYFVLPHSIAGNIALCAICTIVYFCVYLFLPSFVGTIYKKDIWNMITKKLHIK